MGASGIDLTLDERAYFCRDERAHTKSKSSSAGDSGPLFDMDADDFADDFIRGDCELDVYADVATVCDAYE